MNRTVAETMYQNIQTVGLPTWSDADQTLAKALQKELGNPTQPGLAVKIGELGKPVSLEDNMGGGSDDIGDISWNMPTVTLSYPSNIPGLPGHNWSSAIASATPIAHKGVVAGAKVQAMTILDLLTKPELITQAWDYFKNVQTKDVQVHPVHHQGHAGADPLERGDPRQIPRADAEVLLRSDQVLDLPRAVGHHLSDRADRTAAATGTAVRFGGTPGERSGVPTTP